MVHILRKCSANHIYVHLAVETYVGRGFLDGGWLITCVVLGRGSLFAGLWYRFRALREQYMRHVDLPLEGCVEKGKEHSSAKAATNQRTRPYGTRTFARGSQTGQYSATFP